jgi:hypothetical protein
MGPSLYIICRIKQKVTRDGRCAEDGGVSEEERVVEG